MQRGQDEADKQKKRTQISSHFSLGFSFRLFIQQDYEKRNEAGRECNLCSFFRASKSSSTFSSNSPSKNSFHFPWRLVHMKTVFWGFAKVSYNLFIYLKHMLQSYNMCWCVLNCIFSFFACDPFEDVKNKEKPFLNGRFLLNDLFQTIICHLNRFESYKKRHRRDVVQAKKEEEKEISSLLRIPT